MNILILIVILIVSIFLLNYYGIKQELSNDYKSKHPDFDYLSILKNLYHNKFKHRFTNHITGNDFDNIDMVYCICMPTRNDYILRQINTLNVDCKIFDAVKPSDLDSSDYTELSNINIYGSKIYKKYTRLCILLSFCMCFIDALENGYKTIIILEDDIKINIDYSMLNKTLTSFESSDFDVFFMGYCYLNCKNGKKTNIKELIDISGQYIVCTHAVSFKTKILEDLIKYCFPMTDNSDELFSKYYINNKINVCVPRTSYFDQNRTTLPTLNESFDPELKTCIF